MQPENLRKRTSSETTVDTSDQSIRKIKDIRNPDTLRQIIEAAEEQLQYIRLESDFEYTLDSIYALNYDFEKVELHPEILKHIDKFGLSIIGTLIGDSDKKGMDILVGILEDKCLNFNLEELPDLRANIDSSKAMTDLSMTYINEFLGNFFINID